MAPGLRSFLIECCAVIAAILVGIPTYFLTLMWPVLVFEDDIMLAWGWIGGILGLWTGYQAGGYARALTRNALYAKAAQSRGAGQSPGDAL